MICVELKENGEDLEIMRKIQSVSLNSMNPFAPTSICLTLDSSLQSYRNSPAPKPQIPATAP
ncbi:hypothetical protein WIW90_12330 [Sulfolobaceae archaeon RB850M]